MRFTTTASVLVLASSLTQAQAYWLVASYIIGFGGPVGQTGNTWIMSPDLECGTLNQQPAVNEKSDVSGGNGVRIEWTDEGECPSPMGDWVDQGCPAVAEQRFEGIHQSNIANPLYGMLIGS